MENTKKLVKSVLGSRKTQLTMEELNRNFKHLIGHDIPYKELGFATLDQFLYNIPDIVQVYNSGSLVMIRPVVSNKSSHFRNMGKKQKGSRQKDSCGQFNGTASTRNGPEPYDRCGGKEESFCPSAYAVYRPHENKNGPFEDYIVGLRARNAQIERDRTNLLEKNDHLKAQNLDIESLDYDLQNRVAEFESFCPSAYDIYRLNENKNGSFEDYIIGLRERNAQIERDRADLLEKNEHLKAPNLDIESLDYDLQNRVAEFESFCPSAYDVCRPHENKNGSFEDYIAGLRTRNAQIERDRTDLLEKNEHLKVQNLDIESLNLDLQNRVAEFENKMAVLAERNKVLEKENIKFRTKNAELEILQSDVEARYAQLEDRLKNITKEKNDLAKQIVDLSKTNRFDEKSKTLKKYTAESQDINAHIVKRNCKPQIHKQEVEGRNKNKERLCDFQVGDITKTTSEISHLKNLLAEVQDKNYVLKQTNELLRHKIKDLESKV